MKLSKILVIAAALASFAFAQINLNTATKDELMMLPGIGENKAQAIIEYRKANKFKTIEDLKNVKGIGEKRFEKIKSDLTVSGKTDTSNLKSAKRAKKDSSETTVKKAKKDNNSSKLKKDGKNSKSQAKKSKKDNNSTKKSKKSDKKPNKKSKKDTNSTKKSK